MCILRVIEHGLRYKIVLDIMLNLMFKIFVDLSVFKLLFCWKTSILSLLSYHFSFKYTRRDTLIHLEKLCFYDEYRYIN